MLHVKIDWRLAYCARPRRGTHVLVLFAIVFWENLLASFALVHSHVYHSVSFKMTFPREIPVAFLADELCLRPSRTTVYFAPVPRQRVGTGEKHRFFTGENLFVFHVAIFVCTLHTIELVRHLAVLGEMPARVKCLVANLALKDAALVDLSDVPLQIVVHWRFVVARLALEDR